MKANYNYSKENTKAKPLQDILQGLQFLVAARHPA
jgi:hypothetical protein